MYVLINNPFTCGYHVMGVLNVTPDSFSDGGQYFNLDKAIAQGLSLVHQGATLLDIGGESTRPGAQAVDPEEEIRRIVPVISALKGCVPWISVDTRHAKTMEAALKAGANMINDVSALSHDPRSLFVARDAQVPVILMHMQGNPEFMQKKPFYKNVVEDVFVYLKERIRVCEVNRLDLNLLLVDPGIGFGKLLEHNLLLIGNIKKFHDFGLPIVLGTSRKSFIGKLSKEALAENRLAGSLASALWGLSQGVQVFRVHDVAETVQAFSVFESLRSAAS